MRSLRPTYDPTIPPYTQTQFGLKSVKILPCSAVADPGFFDQPVASPFYFVAAEPYRFCTSVLATRAGGMFTVTETTGTSQTDSSTFTTETSMSVSADVGVEYGPASLNVSASYNQSFGTSISTTQTHQTEVQTQIALNLPAQPQTWVWELQTQIAVFSTDTTQLSPVTYSLPDMLFIPS